MNRATILLLACCLALACRTPGPGVLLKPEDGLAQHLVEGLERLAQSRNALRGRARLSVDAPDLAFARPQRMALERPGRLRVEVLGLFDQVAALVIIRDQTYRFFDVRNGQSERGRVDSDILWRVARVDLEPDEAVGLLLGAPRGLDGLTVVDARRFQDGRVAFAKLDARGVRLESYVFDAAGRLLEMQRMNDLGRLIWKASYSDYRSLDVPEGGEQSFAFDLKLEFPRVDAEAKLVFKQVDLPASLPTGLFEVNGPESKSNDTFPTPFVSAGVGW